MLEKAESENDPARKVLYLKEGIDLIDSYLEDDLAESHEVLTLIKNLKMSHTRRLLTQLISIKEIEIKTWIDYIVLFASRLKGELAHIKEQEPELKENYEEFWEVWSDFLKEELKPYM